MSAGSGKGQGKDPGPAKATNPGGGGANAGAGKAGGGAAGTGKAGGGAAGTGKAAGAEPTNASAADRRRPVAPGKRTVAVRSSSGSGDAAGAGAPEAAPPGTPRKKARPEGPKPALESVGLAKSYGDIQALAPLDLTVAPGEAVVLIGHNGSGKTTFLRMAAGLLDRSDGELYVHGAAAGSLPARAALSYLPDNPTFYEDLSVWEHLEYVARLHGSEDWEQRAADLLGALGLYDRADDLPIQFSRGLRQKTSLALGFVRPFSLMLVDEPFVGLDAAGKAALLELLDEAHDEGAALVVATHELDFVKRVPRCVALRDGVVAYDGPTEGIDVLQLVS